MSKSVLKVFKQQKESFILQSKTIKKKVTLLIL